MSPEYIPYYLTSAFLILAIVKTVLFLNSTSKRKIAYWFFFSNHALYNSRNEKTRRKKTLQNRFTIVLLVVLVIDVITIAMFK